MSYSLSEADLLRTRLEASQRIATIGDWESDTQHVYRDCSSQVYDILGVAHGSPERLAETFIERIHPDDLESVRQRQQTLCPGLPRITFDHRIIRPDGEIRYVQQRSELILEPDAEPTRVIGTLQDITELKAAEEELRGKTAVLEAQLNTSIDGILIVDAEGRSILQNDRFAVVCKIPREISELEHDKLQVQHVMTLMKNPEEFGMRLTHLDSHPNEVSRDELEMIDGTVLDRYTAPVIGKDGRYHGRIWTFRDITSKKIVELSLRGSQERFKLVAKTIGDVIWDWNLRSNVIWRSDGFENAFGLAASEEDELQTSWEQLIHEDDRARIAASMKTAIMSPLQTWTEEYRVLRRDGSYAFVEDHAQIVRDPAGIAVRMVGGVRDLTERKNFEARLLRSQRMESIGVLAGGIAHDLNNILAPILMSIDILKQDSRGKEHAHRMLEIVRASAQRGADLVRQVLTFSRGADGEYMAISFRHLFNELENIVRETFPRNIEIEFNAQANLWPVMGDASQLHQVLLNLAVNARDAMPVGGKLMFEANNKAVDADFPGLEAETPAGSYVELVVMDSGTGMTPEVLERMFEAFFTTKGEGKGTGLGLASVYAIVKKYHGFINVTSEVGVGTTFKIYFPVDPSLRSDSRAPMMIDNQRGKGETVLLIDDERSIRDIAQQTLEGFGYHVLVAGDGIEGIALYVRNLKSIDVVITDMMMPNCDGISTINALLGINPQVRIIAASGLEIKREVVKGVGDFLAKPYSAETMLKLLREVLDRPKA
ncbi:hybrid sensor histidine kinase/response regulator [Rariglobus hedericola]|uniref:histidine kinase n=1 Tax=Rariglobus hedericola TaxID=2597822 RepID=A0A556QQ46_9BACT|nr:PAS domain-containing protein [Rariglobus hedericola]TSJ78768.1 PAS domain S-box protein [Rariglobus hedericola]